MNNYLIYMIVSLWVLALILVFMLGKIPHDIREQGSKPGSTENVVIGRVIVDSAGNPIFSGKIVSRDIANVEAWHGVLPPASFEEINSGGVGSGGAGGEPLKTIPKGRQ